MRTIPLVLGDGIMYYNVIIFVFMYNSSFSLSAFLPLYPLIFFNPLCCLSCDVRCASTTLYLACWFISTCSELPLTCLFLFLYSRDVLMSI